MITAEHFRERVGREPENDDLERSNCPKAGEPGHFCCGWDADADLPEFMTMGRFRRQAGDA
jgi:hypothetical protein